MKAMTRTDNSQTETVLAVDLGAKWLGAWMGADRLDDSPLQPTGALLDMDKTEQQWAQAARRLLRGQSRRIARRKLAKRFLKIAARAANLPVDKPDFIRASAQLMNRRGFIPDPENPDDENTRGEGHAPRHERLREIARDISQSPDFENLRRILADAGMPPDNFARMAGHIANMPLRLLRQYFRKTAGPRGELNRWNAPLVCKLIANEIGGWKCDSAESRQRRKESFTALQNPQADILQWWRTTDPVRTIPPFESNANRNPPDCPALLIRPERVRQLLGDGGLEKIAALLRQKRPELAEGIEEKTDFAADSRILQRALDWSAAAAPPFRLRRQAKKRMDQTPEERAQTRAAEAELDADLGDALAQQLRNLAEAYYDEVRDAQKGTWDGGDRKDPDNSALLKRCDRNAPRKTKIRNLLLGRVLGCAPDEIQRVGDFRAFLKGVKTKGNSQVYTVCKDSAKLQKEHGNRLKAEGEMNPESDAGKIFRDAPLAAEKLAAALGDKLGREVRPKPFANPFSLAQLRNILEDEGGRAANCESCARENAWRAVPDAGRADGFRAVSLPSDSVRPFDGILGRILNAQAERLAAEKIRRLKNCGISPSKITIVVEQNQFKFTEDLDDVKKSVQNQLADPKEVKRRKIRQARLRRAAEQVETEKPDRIVGDSRGVCPYAGKALNGGGEFDHIVPRADTKNSGGSAAFNSEANLIFCSTRGNREKGAKRTTLDELHPEYLRAVFETENRAEVEKQIRENLPDPRDFTNFADLRRDHPEKARALRHALFLPDLRPQIIRDFLRTENKARVNGTQKFFARKVWESLKRRFRELGWREPRFDIIRVHARDVAVARRALLPPEWKKPRNTGQGAMSHIADAAMAFAVARGMDAEAACQILPREFRIIRMTRRPPWERGCRSRGKSAAARFAVFGDTMFGERFLPVLVCPDEVRIGFSIGNSVAVKKGGDELVRRLAPFLRETQSPDLPQLQERAKGEKRGFVRLSVNKRAAFDAMQIAWQRDAEFPARRVLESLRYAVSKKELTKERIAKMAAKIPEQFRAGAEFKTSQFRIAAPSPGAPFAVEKGAMAYPAFFAWRKLLENPRICQCLNAPKDSRENLQDILRDHFLGGEKKQNRRCKSRNKFSLPILCGSAIKSGWRIRRSAPQGDIFQTHETAKFVTRGFAAENGVADFHRPVLLRQLVRPAGQNPDNINALAPIGKSADKGADETALFMRPRTVQTENGRGVRTLAPRNSKGAMKVRIALPTADLLKIAQLCGMENPDWREIPPALANPKHPGREDEIEDILALPGGPPLAWGAKKFLRLTVLGPHNAEVEIQTMDGNKNAELWRIFNEAAS